MSSRKKAKGKARKAAKEAKEAEAKAKEEESQAVVNVAANQRQEESVEEQLQRLIINAASPTKCWHGFVPLSHGSSNWICKDFINAYLAAYDSEDKVGRAIVTAYNATKGEYANVYSSKLDIVVSLLLSRGTTLILEGKNKPARLYASLACYFEDYMAAVGLHKSKASPSLSKQFELLSADDHTLVSYYRKRIPCDCLDEKYKEVKSVKKMGLCDNLDCNLPGRKAERSKMFSCTRCAEANYCSDECQRAAWKKHKVYCDDIVEMKAKFSSNQTKNRC